MITWKVVPLKHFKSPFRATDNCLVEQRIVQKRLTLIWMVFKV